jgi:uncharacterized protein DUF4124
LTARGVARRVFVFSTGERNGMRRAGVVVLLIGLLAILAATSTAAADPRFRGRGARSFTGQNRAPSVHTHRFNHHRGFPHHGRGFGVVVPAPIVVYTPPLFAASIPAYTAPLYAAPPVIYGPPPVVYSSPPPFAQPAPAPLPRIVQHPTGRYELRGDGIATPYNWVWIPNPPPPPPPPAPPAETPHGGPPSGNTLPAREQIYQWVDDQGVVHWTNRVDRVPRRYREEVRR